MVRVLVGAEKSGQGTCRNGWNWLECLQEWMGMFPKVVRVVRVFTELNGIAQD